MVLDMLLARREDGHVKLLVYRKKTHTDQYLNFASHHPIQHKLSVIRTLIDRCFKLVIEQKDRRNRRDTYRKLYRSVVIRIGA